MVRSNWFSLTAIVRVEPFSRVRGASAVLWFVCDVRSRAYVDARLHSFSLAAAIIRDVHICESARASLLLSRDRVTEAKADAQLTSVAEKTRKSHATRLNAVARARERTQTRSIRVEKKNQTATERNWNESHVCCAPRSCVLCACVWVTRFWISFDRWFGAEACVSRYFVFCLGISTCVSERGIWIISSAVVVVAAGDAAVGQSRPVYRLIFGSCNFKFKYLLLRKNENINKYTANARDHWRLHGCCEIRLSAKRVRMTNRFLRRSAVELTSIFFFRGFWIESIACNGIRWRFKFDRKQKLHPIIMVPGLSVSRNIPFATRRHLACHWYECHRFKCKFGYTSSRSRWRPLISHPVPNNKFTSLCNDMLWRSSATSDDRYRSYGSSWSWSRSYAMIAHYIEILKIVMDHRSMAGCV